MPGELPGAQGDVEHEKAKKKKKTRRSSCHVYGVKFTTFTVFKGGSSSLVLSSMAILALSYNGCVGLANSVGPESIESRWPGYVMNRRTRK